MIALGQEPMSDKQLRVIAGLGIAQTLAWASSYYLPAVLANAMAADLGVSTAWVFVAFSLGLLISGFCGPLSGRLIDFHGGHRVLPTSKDRKSTRLNSSHLGISYAVFCLKKKKYS